MYGENLHHRGVRLFKSIDDIEWNGQGAAIAATTPLRSPLPEAPSLQEKIAEWRDDMAEIDWVPDLGVDIGSPTWFRGLVTLTDFGPITGHRPEPLSGYRADQARSQMIAPLAYGSDTGIRMAATDAVRPLAESPERPSIELVATLGRGDSLRRVLQRAGVASEEAVQVNDLVGGAVSLGDIRPGTKIDVILGRRPAKNQARPLDQLAFRARFDLNLEIVRDGGRLKLNRKPILVDDTPLRIKGTAPTGSRLPGSASRMANWPGQPTDGSPRATACGGIRSCATNACTAAWISAAAMVPRSMR